MVSRTHGQDSRDIPIAAGITFAPGNHPPVLFMASVAYKWVCWWKEKGLWIWRALPDMVNCRLRSGSGADKLPGFPLKVHSRDLLSPNCGPCLRSLDSAIWVRSRPSLFVAVLDLSQVILDNWLSVPFGVRQAPSPFVAIWNYCASFGGTDWSEKRFRGQKNFQAFVLFWFGVLICLGLPGILSLAFVSFIFFC